MEVSPSEMARPAVKGAISMSDVAPGLQPAPRIGRHQIRQRSPARTALWSLLTVSIYGFWWWWELNRQLRALGESVRPWEALGRVTLGWLVVVLALVLGWPWAAVALSVIPIASSLLSVLETTRRMAALQHATGAPVTVRVPIALGLAGVALVGAVAWLALSLLAVSVALQETERTPPAETLSLLAVSVAPLLGVVWPLVAMAFIAYVQAGQNGVVAGVES